MGIHGKGNGASSSSDTSKAKEKVFVSENKYSVLADEGVNKEKIDWETMKARIDEACAKGLYVIMDEKNNWNEELKEYYKIKLQELVKNMNVESLVLKIQNFEKQIAYSNNNIIQSSKNKANC